MSPIHISDDIISQVLELVLSSERPMPAHFTSGNGRNQTFLIDFDDMTAGDEYEMASYAWHGIPVGLSESDVQVCLKIAEDVMVGSYIAVKEGIADKIDLLKKEIVEANLNCLSKAEKQTINDTLASKEARNYIDFCADFGTSTAGG